jgi:peptidoglycan hydrolase-like protein with peptidoglycan-binding domain
MLLKTDSKGKSVADLSANLIRLGYYSGPKTSLFDHDIKKAVRAFQMQNVDSVGRPLVVDGIAGPVTLASIDNRLNRTVDQLAPVTLAMLPGGSAAARGALAVAMGEYEAGRGEQGGNNLGPDVAKYLNGIVDPPADWCAGFVSYCFSRSGHPMPYAYSVGARDILRSLVKNGWGVTPDHEQPPLPGDIIVWWRVAPSDWKGHVGIVHSYADGIVTTIEGNKTPKVGKFSYTLGAIDRLLGFARVP